MLKGYTKNGKRIIGTYDLVPATAFVKGRSKTGELIYCGRSEIVWDAAETQRENGQIVFVDETYEHILEDEIEWRDV